MFKIYNVAIIGAGQLGSRHLQGLKKSNIDISIFTVDTNPESLKVAEERYQEVESNNHIKSIDFFSDISLLPSHLDLAIIATNSIPRADLTKRLLNTKKVKNIVFEKFLFPSIDDYSTIKKYLKNNNTKAWVNCIFRCFSFYKDLKRLLANSTALEMNVVGKNWGLACNSIHYIDIFSMLTGKNDFEIDTSLLEKIINSKRSGYIEFIGTIKGKSINGDYYFKLTDYENNELFTIYIITEKHKITIYETQKIAHIETMDGNLQKLEVDIRNQSDMTWMIAEQILLTNSSDLPSYSESADLHIQFLKAIIKYYNREISDNTNFCPIT